MIDLGIITYATITLLCYPIAQEKKKVAEPTETVWFARVRLITQIRWNQRLEDAYNFVSTGASHKGKASKD